MTSQRRKVLAGLSDDEIECAGDHPSGPDSAGGSCGYACDCWMHRQDIRAAVQRPSSDDERASVCPSPR